MSDTCAVGQIGSDDERVLHAKVREKLGNRVRGFSVEVNPAGLILRGRTDTFHAKQLVQHTVMRASCRRILANEIDVT